MSQAEEGVGSREAHSEIGAAVALQVDFCNDLGKEKQELVSLVLVKVRLKKGGICLQGIIHDGQGNLDGLLIGGIGLRVIRCVQAAEHVGGAVGDGIGL